MMNATRVMPDDEASAHILRLVAERDSAREEVAFVRTVNDALVPSRDAALAVIEQVRAIGPAEGSPVQRLIEIDRILAQSPATALATVKAAAWDEGAKWSAVELGAIDDEKNAFLAPGDNPYEGHANGRARD